MTPAPSAPCSAASLNDPAAMRAEDAQYYRQVLHELIDMGVDLARLVHGQVRVEARAEGGAEAVQTVTVAYDRIARTIRRTIGLARRLAEPVCARADGREGQRRAARRQIIRAVEDCIHRGLQDAVGRERLEAELFERMDGPELDDDIDHRPVAEIIADIARDLGLAALDGVQPWKRRTPADAALLCARAARAGRGRGVPPGPVAGAPAALDGAQLWTGSDPPDSAEDSGRSLRLVVPPGPS